MASTLFFSFKNLCLKFLLLIYIYIKGVPEKSIEAIKAKLMKL